MTPQLQTQDQYLHNLVATVAVENPHLPAVKVGERTVSYSELVNSAAVIARFLRENGVGAESRVALYLDRSIEIIESILGVFISGGAYVPLDVNAPEDRTRWILQDSSVKVVLTTSENTDRIPQGDWLVVVVDEILISAVDEAEFDLEELDASIDRSPDDLAYIIYTSGSTGRPKGVMISQRNLAASTLARLEMYGSSSVGSIRALQPYSFSFDASIGTLWWTLICGGTLIVPLSEYATDASYLVKLVEKNSVNFSDILTTVYELMLDYASAESPDALNSLAVVLVGSEVLKPSVVKKHYALLPKCRLYNEYGPTESTVWATTYLTKPGDHQLSVIPIGSAGSHVVPYIFDKYLKPVIPQQAGTLWLGGAGVARGYQNLAEQTAASFIPHPDIAGERIYNTGDVVWLDENGQIIYAGRADHQVKLRGVRIELAEVESVILTHSQVSRVAVTIRQVDKTDYLVAYVQPVAGGSVTVEQIVEHCRSRLAGAMIPSYVLVIDALPTLVSGKIDRTALASYSLPVSTVDLVAPRTETEKTVHDIWVKILKNDSLSVHDNFFNVGGHSLLATQIVSRIRDAVGVKLPMRTMFTASTIAELAQLIDEQKANSLDELGENSVADVKIEKLPRAADKVSVLPATYSQEGMWFLQNFAPESAPYNMPFALYLRGRLNVEALTAAFNTIASRHEVYRTSFTLVNGEPMQVIEPSAKPVQIEKINFYGMPRSRKIVEASEVLKQRCQIPFDLSQDPLQRVYLVELEHDEHILLTVTHHTIGDQWSDTILFRELSSLYNSYLRGEEVVFKEPDLEFADYAVWQRKYLETAEVQSQLDFWKEQIDGIIVGTIPTDRNRTGKQTFAGGLAIESLSDRFIARVKEWSSANSVTPFMTLLAGYMVLIARYSSEYDVAVAAPIANRNRAELEDLVGSMVNPLLMRVNLSGNPTFSEALNMVKQAALSAFANQDIPFEKVVDAAGGARGLGSTPLVKTQFNMVTAPIERLKLDGLIVDQFDFDPGNALADFILNIDLDLFKRINVEYATDIYDRETASRFIRSYLGFIEQVISNPTIPISQYNILLEDDARVILEDWNADPVEYPASRISDRIAMQSLTNPSSVAVRNVDGSIALTYSELTVRSNKLAHYLQSQRVQHGSVVGVCLDRTPELVVVLLALMKLGAAYVPLDPAFPKARLLDMVDASGMSVAITKESLSHLLLDKAIKRVLLDSASAVIDAQSGWALDVVGTLDDTAYILFTSGSTGVPKGVEISHRSLSNFLNSMIKEPGFTSEDVLLAITTLSFDISILELFLPLVAGGQTVIATREQVVDGRVLRDVFDQVKPTVMQATPSTWRMLIETGWAGSEALKILSGGEPLSLDDANLLLNRCGELWNMFGPTETTVWSTVERIGQRGDRVRDVISIGRAIDNTSLYVLDQNMQPVPMGIAGELYIGGLGVSKGYAGRTDLTEERFVANPFKRADAHRTLYRTGDAAKWLRDGRLVHLGRFDSQVKIRGYRIELEEIEQTLMRHTAVKQAVVTAKLDSAGNQQLVGYVILDAGLAAQQRPSIHDLRFYLRDILPGYMIPSHLIVLDRIPLTANNKIDRRTLPSPVESENVTEELERSEPSNPLELQLLLLWKQVLGSESLGIHDNFFEEGGHSLKAVQLLTQVNRVIGRELPLATLFQAPSVAQMAKLLTEDGFEPSWRSLVAINAGGFRPPMFAIPGVGGNVLMFARFAKLLGAQQPFYGLQARGLDGKTRPFATIEDAASYNVEEIRSVYPKGPYKLLGVCTGGVIAYEMAQQFRKSGEEVVLMLADTWYPSTYKKSWIPQSVFDYFRPIQFFLNKITGYLSEITKTPISQWPDYVRQKIKRARTVINDGSMEEVLLDGSFYRNQVADATFDAISDYNVNPYDGSLLYVLASKRELGAKSKDTRLLWKEVAKRPSKKIRIPAIDSGQLFVTPHVEEMVAEVEDYLKSQSSST